MEGGGDDLEPSVGASSFSSSWSYDFDVFLSFSGEDTRDFTGDLHLALQETGIRMFMDSERLAKRGGIGNLWEPIDRSAVFVPIFSRNYAESRGCLAEITKMTVTGRSIIPVFYDVDPSVVRHQRGPFEESFRRHERTDDSGTILEWRSALRNASEISGLHLRRDTYGDATISRNEAELIGDIVEIIQTLLRKKLFDMPKFSVGLDSHRDNVMKLLGDQKKDVLMIGICGIGGVGKTVLAKAVFNRIPQRFEASCFISDISEASKQDAGLVSLQRELLSGISRDNEVNIDDTWEGISLIRHHLQRKAVFLVLDGVDDSKQLDALALSKDWFCGGSRIILTTRDKSVLKDRGVDEIYQMEGLSFHESLQLFSNHAFGSDRPINGFAKLSKEVVSTAGGLPLALKAFGTSFSAVKSPDEWQELLDKLNKDQHKDIHQSLRRTFNALDHFEKNVFLDIACYFVGKAKENGIYMWRDCGFHIDRVINVLMHKFLIKINKDGEFEMHPQLQAMAWKIIRDQAPSRFWDDDELMEVLQNFQGRTRLGPSCHPIRHKGQMKDPAHMTHLQGRSHDAGRYPCVPMSGVVELARPRTSCRKRLTRIVGRIQNWTHDPVQQTAFKRPCLGLREGGEY